MLKFIAGILLASTVTVVLLNSQAGSTEPNYDAMLSTVVRIEANDDKGNALGKGSGVALSNGYVASVNHVFAGPVGTVYNGRLRDGTTFSLKVIKTIPEKDIAILQPSIELPHSTSFTCEPPRLGQTVISIGNPTFLDFITTFGRVSGLRQDGTTTPLPDAADFFIIDAPVAPGMSGGPVFDTLGRVLGLNQAILTGPVGQGNPEKDIPPNSSYTSISIIVSGEAICDVMKDLD